MKIKATFHENFHLGCHHITTDRNACQTKNAGKLMFVKQVQFCENIFMQNDSIDKTREMM